MKSSKVALSIAAIGMLFFSGCITMDVQHNIQADGASHISVLYDITEMMASLEGLSEEAAQGETPDPEESCAEFYEKTTWENSNCEINGWIFTMSGDTQLTEPAFTSNGSTYSYDLKNVYTLLNAVSESQGQDFSDEALTEQKEMVELTGITLTYNVTFPGPISEATVGEIGEDGKTLIINLFDIAETDNASVKGDIDGSSGFNPLLLIGVLVILALGGGGFMMSKKKKPASTATTNNTDTVANTDGALSGTE
jgi:hypothetical protein